MRLDQLVVDEVENVTTSKDTDPVGLGAKCTLVVDMLNVPQPSGDYVVSYVTKSAPAPKLGSPLHWDSFIQRICALYNARF
jgi:hypothetical protein